MNEEAELQEAISVLLDLARQDLERYARLALKIRTKEATLIPFEFNAAQKIVDRKLNEQRERLGKVRGLILKARQEGISTYVAARFWHHISLWPHLQGLVVADHRKRSEVLWDIYQRYGENVPMLLAPEQKNAIRRQEVILHNGSQLSVDTAEDPDLGRAMTIHRLHASELAAWARPDQSFQSVMSAVPPNSGEAIVESTAQGVGNTFHWLWEQAEDKKSDWIPIFLPWFVHDEYRKPCADSLREEIESQPDPFEEEALTEGITYEGKQVKPDFEQLAWRRATIADVFYGDARMFRQEFPATADEAFLVAGGLFFDADALKSYEKHILPPIAQGMLATRRGGLVVSKTERGPLEIWEYPQDLGHYVIGVDTASGKQVSTREDADGGRDYSVAYVGDPLRNLIVAKLRAHMSPEAFGAQLRLLGKFYGCDVGPDEPRPAALIAVERNHSSGQTVIRSLRDPPPYPNLFMHRRLNARYDRPSNNYGWITDGTTRRPMLDGLAAALRNGTLGIPDRTLLREMRTFIIDGMDGEPEAQEGSHDDCVIAAAIMLEMFRRHRHAARGSVVAAALAELEEQDRLAYELSLR